MMKNKGSIPFLEYLDELNSNMSDISQNYQLYPNTSYRKLKKDEYKRLVFKNTYIRLLNILLKMYKWESKDIPQRAIELGYIYIGSVCACEINGIGKYILPATPTNFYNVYGEPVSVRVQGFDGLNKTIDIINNDIPKELGKKLGLKKLQKAEGVGVFSRDNDATYPYIMYVREYAYKITDKLIAFDIATQRLKSPFIFAVDEKGMIDNLKTIVDKIESNDDVVVRIKTQKLQQIDDPFKPTQNNMKAEIVMSIKSAILFDFNMFLETIGINTNPSPDKSQVILSPEVNSNNILIGLENNLRLANREKLCEDAKKIGINISVKSNIEELQQEIQNTMQSINNIGGDNNANGLKANTKKAKQGTD